MSVAFTQFLIKSMKRTEAVKKSRLWWLCFMSDNGRLSHERIVYYKRRHHSIENKVIFYSIVPPKYIVTIMLPCSWRFRSSKLMLAQYFQFFAPFLSSTDCHLEPCVMDLVVDPATVWDDLVIHCSLSSDFFIPRLFLTLNHTVHESFLCFLNALLPAFQREWIRQRADSYLEPWECL